MGQAAGILKALDCGCFSDCAKYAFNSGRCKSKCCGCFELSVETDEISVASGDEEEVEIQGCFKWMKK